jgi:predicted nucleic acid-binding protein
VSLVLDCSLTIARVFPDEWTPAVLRVFDEIPVQGAWVTELWRIEVANVLSLSVRKGRVSSARRDEVLSDLEFLPIEIDQETGSRAWTDTLKLAEHHGLTLYDATYLELALRRSLPLATLDLDLRRAAQAEGVPLMGV